MIDVLIYGAGMLGRQVAHLVRAHFANSYRVIGFVDDVKEVGTEISEKAPVVGSLRQLDSMAGLRATQVPLIFGIGYSDMLARRSAFESAQQLGYHFLSLVHPAAMVEPTVKLGNGVTVLAGAILDQFVSIGDASYVHIGTKMGENCSVGINNYFSAGSTLGGSVVIGDDNFLGINVTVVNDTTIGSHNFLNADSLVYRPIGDHTRLVEYREQRDVSMTVTNNKTS